MEDDYLTREYLTIGSVLCQKVVEAIGVEAGISSQPAKSLLLNNKLIQFSLIALHDLLITGHLLRSLSNTLSLKACLLVDLANFHEDH